MFFDRNRQLKNFMLMLIKNQDQVVNDQSVIRNHSIIVHKVDGIYVKYLKPESEYYMNIEFSHAIVLDIHKTKVVPLNIFSGIENQVHSYFMKEVMPVFLVWFQDNPQAIRDCAVERRNTEFLRCRSKSGSFRYRAHSLDASMDIGESNIFRKYWL